MCIHTSVETYSIITIQNFEYMVSKQNKYPAFFAGPL